MLTVNIKSAKKCAFCRYWYDPANSAVNPKAPKINMWEYDERSRNKCLKKNCDMKAGAVCNKYECKFEIM